MMPSENRVTKVLIASRFCGAVAITEKSRRPSSDIASVRGIGVAVSVSTSTSARSAFSASFWRTPKRCSSSMMTRPRRLNFTSFCISLCVPMTMSSLPSASSFSACVASLARLEARQFGDLDRPVGEAVGESLEMLFAEQRGRAQHGHLLAAGHRAEGGAQGDFGLAEADVAADQPVHRLARAHVVDHGGDGGGLVGGFLEAETVGEGFVVVLVEAEGVALARGALRRTASAVRRRCRAPARRPGAWPFPTGRSRACAAALLPDRRRNSARSRAAARPARRAWPRWRSAVRGIPARPRRDPCGPGRDSGRCRGFHAPPDHRP